MVTIYALIFHGIRVRIRPHLLRSWEFFPFCLMRRSIFCICLICARLSICIFDYACIFRSGWTYIGADSEIESWRVLTREKFRPLPISRTAGQCHIFHAFAAESDDLLWGLCKTILFLILVSLGFGSLNVLGQRCKKRQAWQASYFFLLLCWFLSCPLAKFVYF